MHSRCRRASTCGSRWSASTTDWWCAASRSPIRRYTAAHSRPGRRQPLSLGARRWPARPGDPSYLRVIGRQISVRQRHSRIGRVDIILDHRRAETGESGSGQACSCFRAGARRKTKLSMMIEWTVDGRTQWYEASGIGQQRGGMIRPTNGRITLDLRHAPPPDPRLPARACTAASMAAATARPSMRSATAW